MIPTIPFACSGDLQWVTPDTQRNARREAAVLRRLGAGHQNHIVHYIDYFEVGSKVWQRHWMDILGRQQIVPNRLGTEITAM